MYSVEMILKNERGEVINHDVAAIYQLDLARGTAEEIESELSRLKATLLPGLMNDLLKAEQQRYVPQVSAEWRRNGTTPVTLKSLHGKIHFCLQRFAHKTEKERHSDYFELTQQFPEDYLTPGLKELVAYYSNRQSYEEVEKLVERISGERLVSDQKAWKVVVDKALEISQQQAMTVAKFIQEHPVYVPLVETQFSIYQPQEEETLIFNDAILVKEQKETRPRTPLPMPEAKEGTSWISHDVVLLQTPQGFEYVTAGMDAEGQPAVALADVVQQRWQAHYGQDREPRKLVAITDGAKCIRNLLCTIFGVTVVLILDWYHLSKKVVNLMSMIARNKAEKVEHVRQMLLYLWHGFTSEAVAYLREQVIPRHLEKWQELIHYLEKHQTEIIDYGERKRAGKTIGSGRMEKAVDQVVGHRQKKKGISWVPKGSKALAILKTVELNQQWQPLWFPDRAAA